MRATEFDNDNLDDNPIIWETGVSGGVPMQSNAVELAMANTNRKPKPNKPYPGFPLTAHPNGQWCKKIRSKIRFFGVWADPMAALEHYNRQAADLHAGRQPRPSDSGETPTVKDLANSYLASQQEKADRELIALSSFRDCLSAIQRFVRFVGKNRRWDDLRPADFRRYRMHLYGHYGVCAIDRLITLVRSLFKHAYENDLIERPIKYGAQFNKPSAKEKRRNRGQRDRKNGKRLFTPDQIRLMLEGSQGPLRAMILLGINGGFGNTDCAELPIAAVNWEGCVIDYKRPKTSVQRMVPVWPETMVALRSVLAERVKPKDPVHEPLVFLTFYGNPWKKDTVKGTRDGEVPRIVRHDAVSAEFNKLLVRLGLKRPGLGFYALRHTFRTWADETRDQHAIHRIMGHAIPGMSGIYVEEIELDRLHAVVDHVRKKLFTVQ